MQFLDFFRLNPPPLPRISSIDSLVNFLESVWRPGSGWVGGKTPRVAARAQRPKFGSPAPTWTHVHSCNVSAVEVGVEAGGPQPSQKMVNSRLRERQSGGKEVWWGRTRHMTSPSGLTLVHKGYSYPCTSPPDIQTNLKQSNTVYNAIDSELHHHRLIKMGK